MYENRSTLSKEGWNYDVLCDLVNSNLYTFVLFHIPFLNMSVMEVSTAIIEQNFKKSILPYFLD